MAIKVQSIKQHTYAQKARPVGALYEVPGQSDLRLLAALGWVEEHVPPAPPAQATSRFEPEARPAGYRTAAATRAYDALDGETPGPAAKRAYRRRDLTAEK